MKKLNITKSLLKPMAVAVVWMLCSTLRAGTVQNNQDDGGPGTLRAVISVAGNNEIITFAPSVTGTIVLTSGELLIKTNLTIQGPGATTLAIDGNGGTRIFHVQSGKNVTISGLTLQNGHVFSDGGAILNEGTLSLYQCYLTGNTAQGSDINCSGSCTAFPANGGAISSTGSLAMTACTVAYCRALGGNAYASVQGEGGAGIGGGLYVTGSLALTNCTLTWNKALGGQPVGAPGTDGASGGGAIYCANATGPLTLVNCTIAGNQAGDVNHSDLTYGGGITADFLGTLYLINCIVAGNYQVCCFEDVRSRETPIYGTFTSGGGNIMYSGDPNTVAYVNVNGGTDLLVESVDNVRLGILQNNGGPTPTMTTGIGSPGGSVAWDAGNDLVLGAPYNLTTDQRGFQRPGLGTVHVDAGAYEVQINTPCFMCSSYNNWNSPGSGRWDFSSNWGGGSPTAGSSVLITNSGTKTVTIDNFSSTNSLSISDLLMSAPSNTVNSLLINAGTNLPLDIAGTFSLLSGSSLDVSNSIIYLHPHGPGPDPAPTNAAFANGSSVVLDGPASFHNNATFDTSNAFDLTIGNRAAGSLSMSSNCTLNAYDMFVGSKTNASASLAGAVTTVKRALFIATSIGSTGTVTIAGGTFTDTNNSSTNLPSLVMERGIGQLTVSSGATVQFGSGLLGAFHGSATFTEQSGDVSFNGNLQLVNGVLNLQGGTLSVAGDLLAATGSNSVAQINITGGTLLASNSIIRVGTSGAGTVTISNATVVAQQIKLGGISALASGLLRIYSGLLKILGLGGCEACGFSTNDGEVDGGNLDASGTSIVIGQDHNAAFTVNGGTVEAANMFIGYSPGFIGTYTQSGGTVTIATNVIVGDCASGAMGVASMNGGSLYVTNAAHTATLLVSSGTIALGPGATLVADKIIITNSCGHLVNDGTVSYGQLILNPSLDADGDGIPNGVEQANGLDPLVANPVFTVMNNNDSGSGSLRSAINSANGSTNAVVTFAGNVTGSITLTSGGLNITNGMMILGPGASSVTVDGNASYVVLTVTNGNVNISGLTISNGTGGINNNAVLRLSQCVISGQNAYAVANGGSGTGTLAMNNCTVYNNNSLNGQAAILNYSTLAMTNCTVSGNSARTSGSGYALGAGISSSGSATLVSCTVCSNRASTTSSANPYHATGGGIYAFSTVSLANTILAGNTVSNPVFNVVGNDCDGPASFTSQGYNIIGITNYFSYTSSTVWQSSDLTGSSSSPLNPKLGPLQNNGGPTPTHALLTGSPAIDQGLSGTALLDQQQASGPNTTGGPDTWQSFTAGVGGALTQVGLGHWNTPSGSDAPGTVSIYAGEGTSGTLLATTSVTFSNIIGLQLFPIPSAPQVVAGNQYTIRVTIPGAPNVAWVLVDTSNPYSGGRAESGPNYDYVFQTYVVPATTDQRGFPRPYDIPFISNAIGGDGSDIGAFELIIPPMLSAVGSGNSVIVSWPNMGNFILQQNNNLANPGGWSANGGWTTFNGTNYLNLTSPAGNEFFRLKQQ